MILYMSVFEYFFYFTKDYFLALMLVAGELALDFFGVSFLENLEGELGLDYTTGVAF